MKLRTFISKLLLLWRCGGDVVEPTCQGETNREYLLYVMSSIRFLARQALPLRGDGDEKDSNFYQLLVLRGENKPEIKAMMDKKTA